MDQQFTYRLQDISLVALLKFVRNELSHIEGYKCFDEDCGYCWATKQIDEILPAHDALIARVNELEVCLARLYVGVRGKDAFECEYYEGLQEDAMDETRAALAKARSGKGGEDEKSS